MSLRDRFDTWQLCWLSKPVADRALYRSLRQRPARSIVEVGLVSHERTLRLLRLAQRFLPGQELQYTGIDLFDARPAGLPPILLKETHRILANRGYAIRLVPGDAASALARVANQVVGTQFLVFSTTVEADSLARAWSYVPRMLDANCQIWQDNGQQRYDVVTAQEIQQRADQAARGRRAA